MEYYYCKKDKYNNIHSIDNVIITINEQVRDFA